MTSVSFTTTNYNKGPVLKDSITSMLRNLPHDGELIVVDGESTDNSVEILQQIQEHDDRLEIIVEECNLGEGRNRALEEATGDIVVQHLDTDRHYHEYIPMLLEHFRELARGSGDIALMTFDSLYVTHRETAECVRWPDTARVEERIFAERLFRDATARVLPVEISEELDAGDVDTFRARIQKWRASTRDLIRVGFGLDDIIRWHHYRFTLPKAFLADGIACMAWFDAVRAGTVPDSQNGPRAPELVETWQAEVPALASDDNDVILSPKTATPAIPQQFWRPCPPETDVPVFNPEL